MKQPAREGSRKGGIPLDELLATHSAGDARLGRLVEPYGRDVVPASAMAPAASSTNPKRRRMSSTRRVGVPDDTGSPSFRNRWFMRHIPVQNEDASPLPNDAIVDEQKRNAATEANRASMSSLRSRALLITFAVRTNHDLHAFLVCRSTNRRTLMHHRHGSRWLSSRRQ